MSVVCRVDFGSTGFLFMGDAEQEAEAALLASGQNLRADFLKAGHHGSSSSSSEALIAAVRPRYAALTCGAGNSTAIPMRKRWKLWKKYNVTCYRSDLNGTIRAVSDGSAVTVTTEKIRQRRKTPWMCCTILVRFEQELAVLEDDDETIHNPPRPSSADARPARFPFVRRRIPPRAGGNRPAAGGNPPPAGKAAAEIP